MSMSIRRVVAITGCDSGLGWSMAARSAREGIITIAGMYGGNSSAPAIALKKLRAFTCPLDVTKEESVAEFRDFIRRILAEHPNWKLHAVVNNAGVMPVGDFECQTMTMVANTIDINLMGSMRIASALIPDLRQAAKEETILKPRLINVASHCGLQPLPRFGPYSASKAAIMAWTRALRVEFGKHGVRAVAFIPGGFISYSNLVSHQDEYTSQMLAHLSEEQRPFYESKIKALNDHLRAAANIVKYDSLVDRKIIESFMKALMDEDPKEIYKVECWRYTFYYNLLKIPMPETMHTWLLNKFLSLPN